MTKCAGKDEDDDDERKALIQKIAAECSEKETAKKRKASVALVNAAAAGGDIAQPRTALGSQQKQKALLFDYQGADPAVARFFYGCNIPALVVEHPLFKDMAKALACAPAGYKLPNRMSLMYGSLLDRTVRELRTEEAPIREVVMKYGGTVISDGWDDVTRNHLVNLIVGTCKASFFDGTIELRSEDSEDAQFISDLLISHIDRQGKLAIVQICTDTCSVMKAAWKRVIDVLPWITATCCGTHVVSLELNDIGKIKEVAAVMKKVRKVLNLFWGRKRWPRTQLRKVISDNHDGKKFGLYRAKPTRFAGRYRTAQPHTFTNLPVANTSMTPLVLACAKGIARWRVCCASKLTYKQLSSPLRMRSNVLWHPSEELTKTRMGAMTMKKAMLALL